MPERLPPPPGPVRYSHDAVTKEIAAYLRGAPRGTKKAMAAACGLDHTGFSHRLAGRMRFSFEHIGAIAEVARAPLGWPWIRWTDAKAFEAFRAMVASARTGRD